MILSIIIRIFKDLEQVGDLEQALFFEGDWVVGKNNAGTLKPA